MSQDQDLNEDCLQEQTLIEKNTVVNPYGFFPELNNSDACSVAVAVRVRPLVGRELTEGNRKLCINAPESSHSSNLLHIGQKSFEFDRVFWPDDSQEFIFDTCTRNLVLGCFHGYNATILAYGQTGSGKTHSMGTGTTLGLAPEKVGIVPRVFKFIFDELELRKSQSEYSEFKIKVSFLELYNEELHDLLDIQPKIQGRQASPMKDIQIREEKNGTISVRGLKEMEVTSQEECLHLLNQGINHRVTSATNMNEGSSRSHAIFTIAIEQKIIKDVQDDKQADQKENTQVTEEISSKFHFVDLAGSERIKKTGAQGQQLKEGISINRGLLCLGQVISALTEEKTQKNHIPYRDSKLTRILQDSLGGNSRTTMIACVSPAETNYEESLSTIRYASRARNIKNKPIVNRDPNSMLIESLRTQIQHLQLEINEYVVILKTTGIQIPGDISQRILEKQKSVQQEQINKKALQVQSEQSNQQQSSNSNEVKELKIKISHKDKEIKELQQKIKDIQVVVEQKDKTLKEIEKEKDNIQLKFEAMNDKLKQNNIEFDFQQFDQKVGQQSTDLTEKKSLIEQYKVKIQKLQKDTEQKQLDLQEKDKIIQDLKQKIEQNDKILKKHINENQQLKRQSNNLFAKTENKQEIISNKKDLKALRDQKKENSQKQYEEISQKFLSGLEDQFDEIFQNSRKKKVVKENEEKNNDTNNEDQNNDDNVNKDQKENETQLDQNQINNSIDNPKQQKDEEADEKKNILENVKKFAISMLSDMQDRDKAAGSINNLESEKIKAENERKENLIKAKNDEKQTQIIEKEYRNKMENLNNQLQKLEKEKQKKDESVAKQIAMQETRIKTLEADISKWKKKKEETDFARKCDEDRFFKFKVNTSKQIEKEKKTVQEKQKQMEKLKFDYKKVDQLAQQAISQLRGIQKRAIKERTLREEQETRENMSNGIDIDLIKDWITQNTEAMLKHEELKEYKKKQSTEKEKIENEMLEEGDRLSEILMQQEKLLIEKEELEELPDDQKDEGRIIEIEDSLKDISLEIKSISDTLDSLQETLDFIQSKLNQVNEEIETFDMESIAPLEFGALESVESARATLKTFFQVLLEVNIYKRDLEKKCLDQDELVIQLEASHKILEARLKYMADNGGNDGYQALIAKQAAVASFITNAEAFVDNRDIEHLNLNIQEQTNLTKLSLSKIVNNLKKKLQEQEAKNQRISLKLDQALKEKLKLQAKIDELTKVQKTSNSLLLPKAKAFQAVGARLTSHESQNSLQQYQQINNNQGTKSNSFKDRQNQKKEQEQVKQQTKQTLSLDERRKNKKNIIGSDEIEIDLEKLKQMSGSLDRNRGNGNDSNEEENKLELEGVQEEEDDEDDEAPRRVMNTNLNLTTIREDEEPAFASVLEPSFKNNDLFSYIEDKNLPSNQLIEPDQNHSQIQNSEKRSQEMEQISFTADRIKEYIIALPEDEQEYKVSGYFIQGQNITILFDNFEAREISLEQKEILKQFNLQEIERFEISEELEETSIVAFAVEKDLQLISIACQDAVHIFEYSNQSYNDTRERRQQYSILTL